VQTGEERMLFSDIGKGQLLRPFGRPIPPVMQARCDEFNELFNEALIDFLVKGKIDMRNISI
jgi:hypothetical protein